MDHGIAHTFARLARAQGEPEAADRLYGDAAQDDSAFPDPWQQDPQQPALDDDVDDPHPRDHEADLGRAPADRVERQDADVAHVERERDRDQREPDEQARQSLAGERVADHLQRVQLGELELRGLVLRRQALREEHEGDQSHQERDDRRGVDGR